MRLILFSIDFVLPECENPEGFGSEEIFHGDAPFADFALELIVDEVIVETACGGVGMSTSEIDTARAGPIDGTEAHRTGFARGVEDAIMQLEM